MKELFIGKPLSLIKNRDFNIKYGTDRKIIVVKYGGSAMLDPEINKTIVQDIVMLKLVGLKPIIVHGGGPEINNMLGRLGIQSQFINGLRVTTKETMEVVEKVKFDLSFSFVYSKRQGTPAALMEDKVTKEEKFNRLYKLQNRLEELALSYTQQFVGTVQECIVEGISRKDESELKSRASSGRIVVFKGSEDLIGKMVKVKITSTHAHTLKGELIND